MEEVWKDITLTSLTDNTEVDLSAPSPLNPNNKHNNSHHNNNFTLQDFFSRPSQPTISSPNIMPSTPQNVLNLNTTPSFDFPDSHDTISSHGSLHFHALNVSNNGVLMGMNNSACRVATNCNGNSVDRRHKRMIKNRESAQRSRLRKQAYTAELENESSKLKDENKRLRETINLLMVARLAEYSKKRPIFRTYSL